MQEFCLSEDFEMLQYLRHSESLEKCYEFTNSYFSCYSESVNADGKPIEMDSFRISGTRIKRISASPYILCSCLSGMTVNYMQTEHAHVVSAPLEADFGKSGAESGTRHGEQACNKRQNPDKDLKRMQGCEPPIIQDGEVARSAKGGSTNNMTKNNGLLRRFAPRNDGKFLAPFSPLSLPSPSRGEGFNNVTDLSSFRLNNLTTNKRKDYTTMTNNENVKKTLEASALTKRHSEGIRPKNPLHILKRFFAKCKFPFDGNCVRPAQNDRKLLEPQCLNNLVPFSPLSLPSPSGGEGRNNVKNFSSYRLIDFPTLKKKAAFTLAEVLITLGIIGIVATMTIPNLIAEQQKRTTVTKLQRAMSVLNQAYRRAYDDVGEATAEEARAMGGEEYFNKYWAPYLKTAHICKTYEDCGFDSDHPYLLNSGQTAYAYPVDNKSKSRITIKTMDGFIYVIELFGGNNSATNSYIWVDINGSAKPNKFSKDLFFFERYIDGEKGGVVLPLGHDKTDEQINAGCKKDNHYVPTCTEKIRRAGWKIEKDYPW